jgi:hypothetical protein
MKKSAMKKNDGGLKLQAFPSKPGLTLDSIVEQIHSRRKPPNLTNQFHIVCGFPTITNSLVSTQLIPCGRTRAGNLISKIVETAI